MINVISINKFLESNKEFKLVKINYTDSDKKCLKNFSINNNINFNFYGSITDFPINKLNEFLNKVGNNNQANINKIQKIIEKITIHIANGYNTNHVWLIIRTSTPNDDYLIPRWHLDGCYFKSFRGGSYKFVTTLIGDGTLFIKSTDYIKKIYKRVDEKITTEIKSKNYIQLKNKH